MIMVVMVVMVVIVIMAMGGNSGNSGGNYSYSTLQRVCTGHNQVPVGVSVEEFDRVGGPCLGGRFHHGLVDVSLECVVKSVKNIVVSK